MWSNLETLNTEGFRVNANIRARLAQFKRRITRRLDKTDLRDAEQPMFTAFNIGYEIAGRARGLRAEENWRTPDHRAGQLYIGTDLEGLVDGRVD